MKQKQIIAVTAVLALFAIACGQFTFGVENNEPAPVAQPDFSGEGDKSDQSQVSNINIAKNEAGTDYTGYWSIVSDPASNIQFAIPCSWNALLPADYGISGLGAITIRNFDDAYSHQQPRSYMWNVPNAAKADFAFLEKVGNGITPESSLEDFVTVRYQDDEFASLVSYESVVINGQNALMVVIQDRNNGEQFTNWFFNYDASFVLIFAPYPQAYISHADIQGILNSVSIPNQNASINVPNVLPSLIPPGYETPCLKGESGYEVDPSPLTNILPCDAPANGDESLACEIQTALLARDIASLEGLMNDPFIVGYWRSEGITESPAYFANDLDQYRLPADTSGLTFTTDRSEFPTLDGIPPENLMNPEANMALVVYSEGWGQYGLGATLIYIAQNANGEYFWYGMVQAHTHFE